MRLVGFFFTFLNGELSEGLLAFLIYSSVLRITVAFPLSAGRMVISVSFFRLQKASLSSGVVFGGYGRCFLIIDAIEALARSADSWFSHFRRAGSTPAIMSVVGRVFERWEKFSPFCRAIVSSLVSTRLDLLITHRDWSTAPSLASGC